MTGQSMKCKDCVLKHLANAMSYAKEILSGHGIGGTPDHRPDYLGELVNAENHLQHISAALLNRVMVIRTAAQMKRMVPSEADIDTLREIWIDVEAAEVPEDKTQENLDELHYRVNDNFTRPQKNVEEEQKVIAENYPDIDKEDHVAVLVDKGWFDEKHKDRVGVFYDMARRYANHCVILSDIESLEGYSGKYTWVFPADIFIAKPVDMRVPVVPVVSTNRKPSYVMRLVKTADLLKAHEDNPDASPCQLIDTMDIGKTTNESEELSVVTVTTKPCCTTKTRLRSEPFVKVTDAGWPYMKQIWTDGNAK